MQLASTSMALQLFFSAGVSSLLRNMMGSMTAGPSDQTIVGHVTDDHRLVHQACSLRYSWQTTHVRCQNDGRRTLRILLATTG